VLGRGYAAVDFRETRICELRLVPTPMGENFSGSKSGRFGAGGRHQGLLSSG
jgi:hypothetical protein